MDRNHTSNQFRYHELERGAEDPESVRVKVSSSFSDLSTARVGDRFEKELGTSVRLRGGRAPDTLALTT